MTAPVAIIKVKGRAIGKMKNIRATETYQRGDVRGIGRATSLELPVLSIKCTLSVGFYTIDLKKTGIPGVLQRKTSTIKKFVDTLLMQEEGVDIYVYRKTATVIDSETGIVQESGEGDFAVVRDFFLDSNSWDITENQISGSEQSGTYLEPVLFPEQS